MSALAIEAAARHLRLDIVLGECPEDPQEVELQDKLDTAEGIVADYLKFWETGWDDESMPKPVRAAVLLVLSALWDDREGTASGDYLALTGPVARLLCRMRKPSLK